MGTILSSRLAGVSGLWCKINARVWGELLRPGLAVPSDRERGEGISGLPGGRPERAGERITHPLVVSRLPGGDLSGAGSLLGNSDIVPNYFFCASRT